jgi:hypothetical protein
MTEAFHQLPSVTETGKMDKADLIKVMNVLNISAHSTVDDVISKYDSTGQGQHLSPTDFKRVIANHMRYLVRGRRVSVTARFDRFLDGIFRWGRRSKGSWATSDCSKRF